MRKRNNLSLILASAIISGMFSAAAGAVSYKFNTEVGNLLVHPVDNAAGRNTINPASNEAINLILSAGETRAQRFVFEVSEDVLEENMIDPTDDVQARWMGAGSESKGRLNTEHDYDVNVMLKKGAGAVAVRVIKGEAAHDAANNQLVRPIIVEFVANTVRKDAVVDGVLKIRCAGKTQEILINGIITKGDAEDVDPIAEQTIPNGYTYTKENISMIRSTGYDDEFVMNVLPTGTSVKEPITIIVTKAKTMKAGSQVIKAEIYESDEASELYAPEDAHGNKANNVTVFNVGSIATGRVEYQIPVEVAAEELGDLEDGAKVYVYAFDEDTLVADETRYVQGRVIDGKIVFVEDPSKFAREDGEVFLISTSMLQ
ncbi:MAG: hypothetical protein II796_02005 [Oscillospiraceae bacterium]|nr:hypothetical protein [Oscillospiraceae bacterium]